MRAQLDIGKWESERRGRGEGGGGGGGESKNYIRMRGCRVRDSAAVLRRRPGAGYTAQKLNC